MPAQRNGFHWREGWYFERLNDHVRVIKYADGGRSNEIEHAMVIPPNEWASIVASVSKQGETSESYQAALDYHSRP